MAKAEFFNEISTFYGSLSKGKRLSLWLGVGLLFALFIILAFSYSQNQNMGVLFSNLDSQDASGVVKYLKEKNVEYHISKGNAISFIIKFHHHFLFFNLMLYEFLGIGNEKMMIQFFCNFSCLFF